MVRAILALLLLSSCAPQRVQWQPLAAPLGQSATAYGVVWATASFHTAPRADAPVVALWPPADPREPWAQDAFIAVRIVSESDGWASVETLGEAPAQHCAEASPALRALRLRLHVRADALGTVTAREITQSFADGTSITLARGVPLQPVLPGGRQGRGRQRLFRARLGRMSAVVSLSHSDVGTRYLPSEPPTDAIAPDGALAIETLRMGLPILGRTSQVHSADRGAAPVSIYATRAGGPMETTVELRPPCARLRVRIPSSALLASSAPAEIEPPSEATSPPLVTEGVPIYWVDESPAGAVVAAIELRDELPRAGDRRCFEHRFDPSAPPATLCFDPRDVRDRPLGLGAGLADPVPR